VLGARGVKLGQISTVQGLRASRLIASLASSLCLMARFARSDVRREAAVFVGPHETIVSRRIGSVLEAFRRLLLQIGGANIASVDRVWKRDPVPACRDTTRDTIVAYGDDTEALRG
jgi:hypothetical protein